MAIDITSWLENTFCDGPPPEPRRRYRVEVTVRIPDIEPDQLCTRDEAKDYATERIGVLLSELDDFEVTGVTVKKLEDWE